MLDQEEFQIQLEKIEQPLTCRDVATTLLFVIDGEVELSTGQKTVTLQADDLYILNQNEPYMLTDLSHNTLIRLQIKSAFFAHFFPGYYHYSFECFSRELDSGREKIVSSLRHNLTLLVMNAFNSTENSQLISHNTIFQIMLLLTKFFKKEQTKPLTQKLEDERLSRIIAYLENHYDESISLSKVAEQEYLSPSYFSRYFKQKTGMGFLQYLTHIRLKHSTDDLMLTDESITTISIRNGFSSPKHFTDAFKAYYKETPTRYREKEHNQRLFSSKEKKAATTQILELTPEILNLLAKYHLETAQETSLNPIPIEQKTITVNPVGNESLAETAYLLTIGELKELLKDNVKKQIEMVQREIGLDFIGIRHLLRGRTFLPEVETDETVPTSSTFANADLALSYLKNRDLRPFIRIEYQELSRNENFYFEQLAHFLRHSIQVFGHSFVASWAFMYYEPEQTLVRAGELKRVFLRLKQLLVGINPKIQLGTFIPFSERATVPKSHQWFLETSDQVDFLTYNANPNEIIDFSKETSMTFHDAERYTLTKTKKLKQYLKKHGIQKKLMLINWNTLTGNTRYTNGTFFRGALILEALFDVSPEVAGIGFWINTELHEEENNKRNIRMDGLELFHFFNGKRPAYYALNFKEKLYGKVVAQDKDYILMENVDGYQLILINAVNLNPKLSVSELVRNEQRKEVHLRILGLKEGEYQLRKWIFDRDNGALYSKYWQLNSRHGLDEEILDYIVTASKPTLTVTDEFISNDWSFYAYLELNAIHFYELKRTI
ncbi:helix-turn-helix transcriptional regulator [Listeria kieliensis]